jgi:hypothetical protein
MAGYLDAYGVADERRERLIKRIVIWGVSAVVVVAVLYFGLRTHSQEQVINKFLENLNHQQYQDAYKQWGCPENCKYYGPDKFLEDWGPSSKYAQSSHGKIEHVDYCDDGVVFDLDLPDNAGLWVNRTTNFISFYDAPRCPGRHLQIGAFLKSLFKS